MTQLVENRCRLNSYFNLFILYTFFSFFELKLISFLTFSLSLPELEIVEFMFYGCIKSSNSSALATQVVRSNGIAELPIFFHLWNLPIIYDTSHFERNLVNSELKKGEKRAFVMSLPRLCCPPHPSQNLFSNPFRIKNSHIPQHKIGDKFCPSFLLISLPLWTSLTCHLTEMEQQHIQGLRHFK